MADPVPDVSTTPWYLDKALYLTVLTPLLTPLVLWLDSKIGVTLDPITVVGTIAGLTVAVVGFVVAHKNKSGNIAVSQIQAAAAAKAPEAKLNA